MYYMYVFAILDDATPSVDIFRFLNSCSILQWIYFVGEKKNWSNLNRLFSGISLIFFLFFIEMLLLLNTI